MQNIIKSLAVISFAFLITVYCDKPNTIEPNQTDNTEPGKTDSTVLRNHFQVTVKYKTENATQVLFSGMSANTIWQTIATYPEHSFECKTGETVNSILIDAFDQDEVTVTWKSHDLVFNCKADGNSYRASWYSQDWICNNYGCYFDVGTTKETITISVTLLGPMPSKKNSAFLSNLTLSSGLLSPLFSGWIVYYSVFIPRDVSEIRLTPTASDSDATIKVNTIPCISGAQSQPINIKENKKITIEVNMQDSVIKNYILYITNAIIMIDIDGNTYETVQIGSQTWLAKNLKVTHYRNGDPITNVKENNDWRKSTTGAYCAYDNNESYKDIYGYLYNGYAVYDDRKVAPTGWHMPSDSEWQTMVDYLGGNDIAGGKLKETGTSHWSSPNEGATNQSGFTALPGGCREDRNGVFYLMSTYAYFWTADDPYNLVYWSIDTYNNDADDYNCEKEDGFSVRLIKD